MSKRISLASYSVVVREKGETDQQLPLTDFSEGHSIPTLLGDFLDDLENGNLADCPLYVERLEDGNNLIRGRLEGVESGFESEFYRDDDNNPVFRRTPNDEERIPHFFQFHAGEDETKGVFITQKFGIKSIYTPFKKWFSEYVAEKSSNDYLIEFRPHVPSRVFERLREGDIKKIILRKFTVPDDIAGKYSLDDVDEETAYLELSINTKRGKTLGNPGFLGDLLTGSKEFSEVTEMDLGIDLDENDSLSVEVKYSGKTRKVNLRDPRSITPTIELTDDDIDIEDTGHPEYNSIREYSFELLQDLREELGLV